MWFHSLKDYKCMGVKVNILRSFSTITEWTFDIKPYKLHRLDVGPQTKVRTTKSDALKFYRQMQMIRRLETAAGNLYKEKLIRGFCHLYSGQEACAVGIGAVLREKDTVVTGHRVHGWAYLKGVSPAAILAELAGRKSGCSAAKGGSTHMYATSLYGGQGIVGAQVPLGVGAALARKYLEREGCVSLAVYGDGAADQGQVYEAFNMAALWKLPVLFVCENNSRRGSGAGYYTRGDYIPGIWVDGMDVLAVREAASFLVERCRSGGGPVLLEVETYRSPASPLHYSTSAEIRLLRITGDPIMALKHRILQSGMATQHELKVIDSEARKEIETAVAKAKKDEEPSEEELATDIYCQFSGTVKGVSPWQAYQHTRIGPAINK